MPAHNSMVGAPPAAYQQRSPSSGFPQTQSALIGNSTGSLVIDGTPLRVVLMAGVAVGTLALLRWGGFKFHVTVGA